MDQAAVLTAYDRQIRQSSDPGGPGARIERVDGVVRRVGANDDDWNGVLWSDLDATTADAAIAAQVAYFAALGREFEWKAYSHDLPHDLPERLRAAGLVPDSDEAMMVADVADLPQAPEPPEGVRLVPVTDEEGVRLMTAVHEAAFGTDGTALGRQVLRLVTEAPDTVAAVVAMAGDEPVSSARLELLPGTEFAGLWGGGTVEHWRGRGIYRSLIAYRARIAAERGVRYLQVDASDQSRPILARLGFTQLSTTTPYTFRPDGRSGAGA
ncbi:GNAT family N-acetyltransferase [Streptomyces sp. G45]|uniref:GNAT family N-acetyltransferase n=1 Tax=Streptomyces sp. G45 TaxID=3406627 RepID=UPI003C1D4AB9